MDVNVQRIYETLREEFLKAKIPTESVYIAGGALLGYGVKDIDIFCENVEVQGQVKTILNQLHDLSVKSGYITFRIETDNALSVLIEEFPVQLITKYYGNPEEVVTKFDFIQNSKFATFTNEVLTVDDTYSYDVEGSNFFTLKLTEEAFTEKNLISRLHRMLQKGFIIEKDELIALLKRNIKAIETSNQKEYNKKDFTTGYGGY